MITRRRDDRPADAASVHRIRDTTRRWPDHSGTGWRPDPHPRRDAADRGIVHGTRERHRAGHGPAAPRPRSAASASSSSTAASVMNTSTPAHCEPVCRPLSARGSRSPSTRAAGPRMPSTAGRQIAVEGLAAASGCPDQVVVAGQPLNGQSPHVAEQRTEERRRDDQLEVTRPRRELHQLARGRKQGRRPLEGHPAPQLPAERVAHQLVVPDPAGEVERTVTDLTRRPAAPLKLSARRGWPAPARRPDRRARARAVAAPAR